MLEPVAARLRLSRVARSHSHRAPCPLAPSARASARRRLSFASCWFYVLRLRLFDVLLPTACCLLPAARCPLPAVQGDHPDVAPFYALDNAVFVLKPTAAA